jgi:hypothetical protein
MNIMDEFHLLKMVFNVPLLTTSFTRSKTWACLNVINEIHAPSPWHSISS